MKAMFGSYFKELRREMTELSLRKFCEKNGYDPGNISKLERGILPPPQSRDKIRDYAEAIGLEEGSEEWVEFFDRAAASRGDIPQEILNDEEIAGKLPVLFRTLRGDRVAEDELDKLIQALRKS